MANAFRIGIVGLQHDHLWSYLGGVRGAPGARITCAADPHANLREKAAKLARIPAAGLYEDHFDMLERERLDACLVFAANARHAELTESCARRGLHVMVEKPIASTSGAPTGCSTPPRSTGPGSWSTTPPSSRVSRWSAIGRWRRAPSAGPGCCGSRRVTPGPETFCSPEFLAWLLDPVKNGGGALQDLCTCGAALYAWYFGRPYRVSAQAGTFVKRGLSRAETTP